MQLQITPSSWDTKAVRDINTELGQGLSIQAALKHIRVLLPHSLRTVYIGT